MKESVKLKDSKTCRIFFSSPFGGMEEEREELTKKFFPQIHHACNEKGIKFVPVDMRWGITKEAAENAQVMNICLREVERSDFFVGFFGQRYGWHLLPGSNDPMLMQNFDNAMMSYPWVDQYRDCSMTEVEWRAGHLNNPGAMPSCFCFRDKKFDDAVSKEAENAGTMNVKAKYSIENDYAAMKLQMLTENILASREKTYGVMMDYKTPQEGAKFIFDKIWHFVTEVVLKDVNEDVIPHTLKLRQVHDLFAKSQTNLYCGCQEYFQYLDSKIQESDCQGVLVTGPAGCGKSSLFANWLQSLERNCPDLAVIYHFVGCAPGTERPKSILERLLLELKAAFPAYGHKSPEPEKETPRTPVKNEKSTLNDKNNIDGKGDANASNKLLENGETILPGSRSEVTNVGHGDSHIDSTTIYSHDENSNKKGVGDKNNFSDDNMTTESDKDDKLHIDNLLSVVPVEGHSDEKGSKKDVVEDETKSACADPQQKTEMLFLNASEILAEKFSDQALPDKNLENLKHSVEGSQENEKNNDNKSYKSGSVITDSSILSREGSLCEYMSDQELSDGSTPDINQEEENLSDKDQDTSEEKKKSTDDTSDDKKDVKAPPEQKKSSQQLLSEVNDLLKSIGDNDEKVVIVIDALNQQQKMEKTRKHLYWLPESFPKGVTFICSSLDLDTATHDLLVQQRGLDALSIKPIQSSLKLEICVESLKISGKELSPHQLDRIVFSTKTTNPLFLKLVVYELSIYGNFRKLDEKIDSLISVNGVKPLLQVILSRLEEDYNSTEYNGNLVKDVLCCLIASKQGVSESEIIKILSIPSNSWSPLFFALEQLLVQYTGLLGFAFTEVRDAVNERYLKDQSVIVFYKKKLIAYFDSTRLTMKPWEKNNGLEFNRVLEELPWLQQDIKDIQNLINTLSDISIMKKMVNSNANDLLELWQSTGLAWSAVLSLYMKAFDADLVSLYQEFQDGVIELDESPGSKLRVNLQYLRMFFDVAYYADGNIQAMKREIIILENCRSKYSPEKKAEYLRDSRYYLAVAYSDRQKYDDALPLYLTLLEDCEKILSEKKDSPAEELLAYTCNGIGLVYYGRQEYPEALKYLQRSESMHKERNEKRHQGASMTNIGLVYINQKQYEKALEVFGEAMKLYEDHFFGEMPLDVGNLLTNIALTYRRMKDLDKAEEYYHKSLEMKAKNVGWYHPVIAVAYMNLGTLEVHRKNYVPAEEWTRKALHIYELNEFPVTDRSHRMCRENLCMNMLKQDKKSQLLPLYLEVTNILVDNGWIAECIVPLHRDMIEFILETNQCDRKEVEKFLVAILTSPKRRACFAYHLANMDSMKSRKEHSARPEDLTLKHFVKEYPSDSKIKVLYVTEILAKEDKYDEILEVCLALHDKEKDLKESAFSLAAEPLVAAGFHHSAKKILHVGLEQYPAHMELVDALVDCLIALNEAKDLIPYIPAMLEVSDWDLLSQEHLMATAKAMQSIDPELAGKCYTKLIQDGHNLSLKMTAKQAMKKLFPDDEQTIA